MLFKSEFTSQRDKRNVADLHLCYRLQALVNELENFRADAIDVLKRDRTDPHRRMLAGVAVNLQYEADHWSRAAK